ncbi:serine/threonine-protein phosphatase 7 long form homolog [Arachis hypogaea]|uniref:serine/threonine-protein phosphatase 7 long form homolog n=1 Tax=Arachis hypogaea TaxID=3818 RepID=UPI003B2258B2
MEDERRLYRLDGVAHVAGTIDAEPTRCVYSVRRQQNMPLHNRIIPYLERAGLYHLARLNAHWFWLDEPLVSAFIERWRPETHTFHMPFGECTITLQDVAYQLGLPVDGQAISGCMTDFHMHIEGARPAWEWFEELFGELPPPDKRKLYTVHLTWFHERFKVLPADASEETVRIYARTYIMMLLSTQLFMDKSANRVHLRWLPFVARLDDMGSYSWGATALAWLYRCMCRVANRNVTNLAGPLQLLQSWIFWRFPTLRPPGFDAFYFPLASRWATYLPSSDGKERRIIQYRLALDRLTHRDIMWEPYGSLDVLAVIHSEILTEEHSRLWRALTSLIYFAVIEWHQVDRVFPQLGGVQHLPEPALNIEYLHSKDGRGGDRWFPTYYRTWHQHWDEQVRSVLSVQRVPDPTPSPEYLDWWHRVAHKILSPGIAFADPKPTQVPNDAILRGSSQAPTRVPVSDMPDNRRLEQRRCIGTHATYCDWRWLDDMMQEEQVGGDDGSQADHRLR